MMAASPAMASPAIAKLPLDVFVKRALVYPTEDSIECVWDEHTDPFTNTVSVTVARLRKKLGEPEIIDTVVGSGYRIA